VTRDVTTSTELFEHLNAVTGAVVGESSAQRVPPSSKTAEIPKPSALAEQGDLAFREPLVITREGIVIDGYARSPRHPQSYRTTHLQVVTSGVTNCDAKCHASPCIGFERRSASNVVAPLETISAI
jgi:hypothetical protein